MKGPSTTPKKGSGGDRGGGPSTPKNKDKTKDANVDNVQTPSATPSKIRPSSSTGVGVDVSQLSAYAVYNNLVPGVKSYEDTSQSTPASLRKKSKKRKKAEVKKQEDEAAAEAMNASKSKGKPSVPETTAAGVGVSSPRRITPIPVPSTSFGEKNNVLPANANEDGERSRKKKKRNRKKKNNNNTAENTQEVQTNGVNISKSSTISAEPPRKVRKIVDNDKNGETGNLFPNPLAKKNASTNKGTKGSPSTEVLKVLETKSKETSKSDAPKNQKKTKRNTSRILNSDSDDEMASSSILAKDMKNTAQNYGSSEPPELQSILNAKVVADSVKHGKELFAWLIHPQSISNFMESHWEKQTLLVKRGQLFPEYFDWILSSAKLDDILRRNNLKYSKNIDVVYYDKGERITVSEDMTHRVRPAALWDYYGTGNSIRLLNPQTYCSPLRRLNATLQETFGTFVGANVYLTPPDAQGFAPHWDDIEAFVLQVEGKKRWKLYKPRNPNEVLPRFSSKDFGKEEETLGAPFMDVVLEPGDLLYFPRGTIHQASTVPLFHSMHITISCYQQNCWADLLKQHFSKAVDKLASSDVDFRKGLPLDYLSFMGLAASKKKDSATLSKRKDFKVALKRLVAKVGDIDADDGADEMGKKFIWDSLPPYLTRKEKDKTVIEDGEFLINGKVKNRVEMDPDTKVKLVRKHCVRLIYEESCFRLYHTLENGLVYHEEEPNFVEISDEFRSSVELLINSYPDYVRIEDLPIVDGDLTKKIQIISDLWERGLIMTEKRLEGGEICEDFDFDDGESVSQDEEDEFDDGEGSSDLEDFIEGDDVGFDLDSSNEDEDEDDDDEMEMSDMSDDDDEVVQMLDDEEVDEEEDDDSDGLGEHEVIVGSDEEGEEITDDSGSD